MRLLETWLAGRARRAAASWIVRMHGPDAQRWRQSFEAWRLAHSRNAEAYARLERVWGAASRLGAGPGLAPVTAGTVLAPRGRRALALASAGLAGLAAIIWSAVDRPQDQVVAAAPARDRLEQLADGSELRLAGGALVELRFGRTERYLRLRRGRARIAVAPDASRPAVLRVGAAEVRTSAARLDVGLDGDQARIVLLAGAVRLARYGADQPEPLALDLKPGEQVEIAPGTPPSAPRPASPAELHWPTAMISFDDAPLAEVLARANAVSLTELRASDPGVAERRVTGAYRMDDSEGLAASLAATLGLRVRKLPDGALLLSRPR